MTRLPITSLLAAFFSLMMVALSLQVSIRRMQSRTAFGDGDESVLRRRVRAHGNFVEYMPLALVVIALLEVGGAPATLTGVLALGFATSRILHALLLLYVRSPAPRAIAMTGQHLAFLISAAWLLNYALKSLQ